MSEGYNFTTEEERDLFLLSLILCQVAFNMNCNDYYALLNSIRLNWNRYNSEATPVGDRIRFRRAFEETEYSKNLDLQMVKNAIRKPNQTD